MEVSVSPSTSSVTVDENGLRHFRMDAETGHLGLTGNSIGEGMDDRSSELPEPIVPGDLADGVYSNLAYIRTSTDEVVLDFARVNPNSETPVVKARVVLLRGAALGLAEMLTEKLKQ